jgi:hypothetical protein
LALVLNDMRQASVVRFAENDPRIERPFDDSSPLTSPLNPMR